MEIYSREISGFCSTFTFPGCSQEWEEHFVTQNNKSCHRPESFRSRLVSTEVIRESNQFLSSQLFQAISGMARFIAIIARDSLDLIRHFRGCKALGFRSETNNSLPYGSYSWAVSIDTSYTAGTCLRRQLPGFYGSVVNKRDLCFARH